MGEDRVKLLIFLSIFWIFCIFLSSLLGIGSAVSGEYDIDKNIGVDGTTDISSIAKIKNIFNPLFKVMTFQVVQEVPIIVSMILDLIFLLTMYFIWISLPFD